MVQPHSAFPVPTAQVDATQVPEERRYRGERLLDGHSSRPFQRLLDANLNRGVSSRGRSLSHSPSQDNSSREDVRSATREGRGEDPAPFEQAQRTRDRHALQRAESREAAAADHDVAAAENDAAREAAEEAEARKRGEDAREGQSAQAAKDGEEAGRREDAAAAGEEAAQGKGGEDAAMSSSDAAKKAGPTESGQTAKERRTDGDEPSKAATLEKSRHKDRSSGPEKASKKQGKAEGTAAEAAGEEAAGAGLTSGSGEATGEAAGADVKKDANGAETALAAEDNPEESTEEVSKARATLASASGSEKAGKEAIPGGAKGGSSSANSEGSAGLSRAKGDSGGRSTRSSGGEMGSEQSGGDGRRGSESAQQARRGGSARTAPSGDSAASQAGTNSESATAAGKDGSSGGESFAQRLGGEAGESGGARNAGGNTRTITKSFDGNMQNLARQLRQNAQSDIVRQARFMFRNANSGEIRLILKPEHLGQVRIQLQLQDNHIAGRIIVENSNVRDAFEENMQDLQKAFRDQGMETGSLEVSVGQQHESAADAAGRKASQKSPLASLLEDSVPVLEEIEDERGVVNLYA